MGSWLWVHFLYNIFCLVPAVHCTIIEHGKKYFLYLTIMMNTIAYSNTLPSGLSHLQSVPTHRVIVPMTVDTPEADTAPGTGNDTAYDQITLSRQGRDQAAALGQTETLEPGVAVDRGHEGAKSAPPNQQEALTQEEQQAVMELKRRDLEVRAHEQAHLARAGQYARGGANFTYQTGPDGRRYAIGGEVGIDTGKEADPQATIQKMQTVRAAALAPASPSAADRQIAATATRREMEARSELRMEQAASPENSQQETTTQQPTENQGLPVTNRSTASLSITV
jgi:hypothetical protein